MCRPRIADTFRLLKRRPAAPAPQPAYIQQPNPPTQEELRSLLTEFRSTRQETSTRTTYSSYLKAYTQLCTRFGLDPAKPESLALAIMLQTHQGWKYGSIHTAAAAVKDTYGAEFRTDPEIHEALQAAERWPGTQAEPKLPLSGGQLQRLRDKLITEATAQNSEQAWFYATRDWTFYLLAFLGMFRGAELANLEWADIDFGDPQGVIIFIGKSKTDPARRGAHVSLSRNATHVAYCPQANLEALRAFDPRAQMVFTAYRKDQPLTTTTFRLRLQRQLQGIVPADRQHEYALHSLRRGGATAAAMRGIPIRMIKRHGRWRSDVVYLYTLVSDQEAWAVTQQMSQLLGGR